jgi:universal stress protein A
MFEPKRILVPTDFSEHSDKALKEALDIAEKYNSKIYLLHVIDKQVQQCAVDYCLSNADVEKLETDSVNWSSEMLKKEISKFDKTDSMEIELDIKKGDPFNEIVKEQKDKKIDLVVMSSFGRTGLKKYMLGSVADKVIRNATSQVLMVKD